MLDRWVAARCASCDSATVSTQLCIFAIALAACSSSTTPGTISGPIKGKTFAVNDALTLASTTGVEIALTSNADACVPPAQQIQHPGETALLLLLSDYDAASGKTTAPTMPAAYPVTSSMMAHVAIVEANILDAMCANNADNAALATTGTVELTGVDGGTFSGTFDVQLDSGDHVTGSFDAPTCTEPKNPQPACQ
jgi:hypothetical protein